jgi:hypothetical protein|tara:strand:+ start:3659 stop:3787 length:129 start_codon:yes stop_codon:yes gene_type:complete
MHSTEEGAIEYCEERRKNGSVFYIIEIPALITWAAAKTECNT